MTGRFSVAVVLVAGLAWGQGTPTLFQKAPPDVDSKLRARISAFYQAHVDGKFRFADSLVHEDSKETFFVAEKTRFKSFKFISIQYEADYTKAKVVIEIPWELIMPGFGRMSDVPRPISSTWKLDAGEWWWYVEPFDPCKGVDSPFGQMHKQECKDGKPVGPVSAGAPSFGDLYQKNAVKIEDLRNRITVSSSSVELSSHEKSAVEVTVTSQFDGPVTLSLEMSSDYRGLEASLNRQKLEPGESAIVRFQYDPPSPTLNPDIVCSVRVMPINQLIPIAVRFAIPPVAPAAPAPAPKN